MQPAGYALIVTVFPAIMLAAAVCDLATLTIPNRLSLCLAALFPPAAWFVGLTAMQAGGHALTAAIVLAAGMAAFAAGRMGGGDVKIAAAGALWLGWPATLTFLAMTAVAGGIGAAGILLLRRSSSSGGVLAARMPYGPALAIGAIGAFAGSHWVAGPAGI